MFALISHNDKAYQPLADLTWTENKVPYCERYGYVYFNKTDDFETAMPGRSMSGFEKIYIALDMLTAVPELEWVWWTGTDTLITNFTIRIQDKIDNNYHFMICVDNNGVNADSFLVRNTTQGRDFLREIIANEPYGLQYWDHEQRAINRILGFPGTSDPTWPTGDRIQVPAAYQSIVRLLPQKYMNSFDYSLYHYRSHNDRLGNLGNWQPGDWLIHWPGTDLSVRLKMARAYKEKIIQ